MASTAAWCFRRRYLVIVLWIAALAGLGLADRVAGTAYSNSFTLPGTESTHALDLLKSAFPQQAGESDTIVWRVSSGSVRDAATEARITTMLDQVAHAPSVAAVNSPYARNGAAQISRDGRTAYATVFLTGQGQEIPTADVQHIIDLAQAARANGLQVELGGQAIQQVNHVSTSISELVGVSAAAVILLIAFGSLLSMLLPIVTAILSLIAAIMSIGLISHAMSMAMIAPTIAALIGLGVGIDYALFIVTRHRTGLKAGLSTEESAVRALNTSGRAVIFAGLTVCVAMLGMLVLNLSFLTGVGVSAAVMVAFSVLAATTLLPAMLGVLGHRVLSRRERRRLATDGPTDVHAAGFWARWAGFVQRRPGLLTPIALLVLAALIIPMFSLRLGTSDQGNDPAGTTTRKAYDLLADGFGPGFNGPLQLVAKLGSSQDSQALAALAQTVAQQPGVATAVAFPSPPGATVGIIQVIPTTAPQDAATSDLIQRLRHDTIPAAEQGHDLEVYVGGLTAIYDDFAGVLTGKLPFFIGVIVALGCLLLLLAFRSIVVPLTAAVMNLLAAGASFGVVVAFFQWGWGSDALGLGKAGPVEAFLPVMMIAILFGLSMDYQVFLVSRMHEEWVNTRDNRRAVTVGQASTGRVITAAAAIMICVFTAFVFGGQRVIAEFGIGLASAVFIDAFILRTVLVPALMHMFGKANWWLPRWIDSWLPHLSARAPLSSVPADTVPADSRTVAADLLRPAEPVLVGASARPPTGPPVGPPVGWDGRPMMTAGRPAGTGLAAQTLPTASDGSTAGWGAGGPGLPVPGSGPGLAVRGAVRRAGGSTISGAALTLIDHGGRQVGHGNAGGDGGFTLNAPQAGSYVLVASAPGHQPWVASVLLDSQPASVQVVLAGASGLTGLVRVAGADQRLAGALVTLTNADGEVIGSARTSAEGRYHLTGLLAGAHILVVTAEGYRPVAVPLSLAETGEVRHDVDLIGAAHLSGTVRTRAGEPVPGARITVTDQAGNPAAVTHTDTDGEYVLTDLADGDYTISASGYPPVATQTHLPAGEQVRHDVELAWKDEA